MLGPGSGPRRQQVGQLPGEGLNIQTRPMGAACASSRGTQPLRGCAAAPLAAGRGCRRSTGVSLNCFLVRRPCSRKRSRGGVLFLRAPEGALERFVFVTRRILPWLCAVGQVSNPSSEASHTLPPPCAARGLHVPTMSAQLRRDHIISKCRFGAIAVPDTGDNLTR
jgi:hypothetical protein